MTKLLILLFTLQSFSVWAQPQKDTINAACTTVIAVNGLNIREKPGKNSKLLKKIPFGGKIKYLSKYSFGTDTIRDYSELGPYIRNEKFTFTGKWAKISYKGTVGYVMDAYLYYDNKVNKDHTEDSAAYALLYSYTACYANLYTPSKFHWYGLFQDSKGTFSLKKVNINYFSTENDAFGGKDIGVSTGNDQGLLVIIGSKKIMKEGIRNCADIEKMREENNQILDESNLKSYGIERLSTNKYDKGYQTFIIQNGSQKQVINEKALKKKVYPFTAIRFVGDIDGDNIMDYIIGSDAEQSYDVLFLSGEQKGTNLVEPVAYFYMHYCC